MNSKTPITVAYGDGIGPEIMTAALRILQAGGAALELHPVEIGEQVYLRGQSSGIGPEAWAALRQYPVFYKAPITTPQGGGYKSLNVTIRKTLSLFANVRPCVSYHPFVRTNHPAMDLVIVRENEEDLYGGIEHRQTDEVYQCLKLITRPGTERITRYAFEYARRNNRQQVACFTKDNIMKMTDGLFHKIFKEVAAEYPDLEHEHWIIDIGTARMADTPEDFDVIVVPNLYGDILSDVAAQIAGSVGMGGSANIGARHAMFEAIHGSAPLLAGKDLANPSGLLLAGVMMLVHIGQTEAAERIHNAWLRAIEDGVHTFDIYKAGISSEQVGTQAFADAVIARLGQLPEVLAPVSYASYDAAPVNYEPVRQRASKRELVGVDVFLYAPDTAPDDLGSALQTVHNGDGLRLEMITNRGQKVWPDGLPETFCTDHWRCRFVQSAPNGAGPVSHGDIVHLLARINQAGFDFIKIENLFHFDGEPGYSLGQGQ